MFSVLLLVLYDFSAVYKLIVSIIIIIIILNSIWLKSSSDAKVKYCTFKVHEEDVIVLNLYCSVKEEWVAFKYKPQTESRPILPLALAVFTVLHNLFLILAGKR